MRMIPVLVCVPLLACALTALAADDKDRTASKDLIRQGNALLDKGKYDQALDKFQQAYRRFPSPKIFFNQAQALQDLGRNLDALLAYRRFLAEAKDASPEVQADAQRQIDGLSTTVGRADIRCNRQGALVSIDGKTQGTTPLPGPVFVEPGSHEVALVWQGEQKSVAVDFAAGVKTTTEVDFGSRSGSVEIASNRKGAIVVVDGNEVGTIPLGGPLTVSPGGHALSLAWNNEQKLARFTVPEGGTVSLSLDFEDKPAIVVDHQPPPPPDVQRSWLGSHWFWVAGGAIVAGVATTLVLVYGSQTHYPSNTMGTQAIGN